MIHLLDRGASYHRGHCFELAGTRWAMSHHIQANGTVLILYTIFDWVDRRSKYSIRFSQTFSKRLEVYEESKVNNCGGEVHSRANVSTAPDISGMRPD